MADHYAVSKLPTLMLFKGGMQVGERVIGWVGETSCPPSCSKGGMQVVGWLGGWICGGIAV